MLYIHNEYNVKLHPLQGQLALSDEELPRGALSAEQEEEDSQEAGRESAVTALSEDVEVELPETVAAALSEEAEVQNSGSGTAVSEEQPQHTSGGHSFASQRTGRSLRQRKHKKTCPCCPSQVIVLMI
ncbi:MAG: hypothetical protein MJE68_03990 [Proteobacteria bacterium]|nr:hypothetical protein [Pseudomonadota bacterium]